MMLHFVQFYEYTVTESFEFAHEIKHQTSEWFMPSHDICTLSNVPLNETIKICIDNVFGKNQMTSGLKNQHIIKTLSLTINKIFFYLIKITILKVVSLTGVALTNIFYVIMKVIGYKIKLKILN